MCNKFMKYLKVIIIAIIIVSTMAFSLTYIVNQIISPEEYEVNDLKFSLENLDLFAAIEINESSANAANFTEPIKGSTVWPIVDIYIYTDNNLTKTTGKTISALTECIVTDVSNYAFKVKYITNGKGWQDSDATVAEAWVNAHRLLINLPDVCPDIQYNITNAYSSIFKIGSSSRSTVVNINGLTGEQLYTYDNYDGKIDGKVYNSKLGKEEFVCPLIYPFAEEVAAAQSKAKEHGYVLKIYDAYRPQKDVCDKFWSLTYQAMNASTAAYNLINKDGWSLGWFVANPNNGGSSDHARGTAIDVTLVKDGKEIDIPSDMHDLSTNSVKQISPYPLNYNAAPTANYTEGTKLLHQIMVEESGMGGLPSEWWHFNTLSTDYNNYAGSYNVTYTDKTQLKITNTEYSTKEDTNQNVTVTITANKDIKTAIGSKSSNWQVNGKTAKKIYTKNYEEDVITLTDGAGNKVKTTINVTNIDQTAPVLEAPEYSNSNKTKEDVTVTVTSNEIIAQIVGNGWNYTDNDHKKIQKTYSNNVKNEKVQVKDLAGNISEEVNITISNIDKMVPEIEKILYDYDNSRYVFVIISANEEIDVTNWGKAIVYSKLSDSDAEKYDVDKDNSVKLWYKRENSNNTENTEYTDTIRISDIAGNEIEDGVEVKVDIFAPTLEVDYRGTYNGEIEVIVTATDEKIEKYEVDTEGWERLDDYRVTKTFSNNATENIIIYDKNGNKKKQNIRISNIDREAPYIINKKITTNTNGSINVILTFNEPVKSDDTEWIGGSGNILYKTYTEETREVVTVKDGSNNTYEFEVIVTRDTNGNLQAAVNDMKQLILEDIIYGTTAPTNENVNVTIIVNKEVIQPEGWNLSEGIDELAGKWLLTKTYKANVQDDVVEIIDTFDNKIIGENVTDGKVHINISNIDRISPTITNVEFIDKENGKVQVNITLSEAIGKAYSGWNIVVPSPNPIVNVITKTFDSNTNEVFEVSDLAGNIATIKVDVANKKVVDLPMIEEIYNNIKSSNADVPVRIVVNKKIKEVENWDLLQGTDDLEGKWILSRTYTSGANENILIEDEAGNKGINDTIDDGIVPINITIDKDEISIVNIDTNNQTGQIRITFNKKITEVVNNNWQVDHSTGEVVNTKKFIEDTTETIEVKDASSNVVQIQLDIKYNEDTAEYIVTEAGKENKVLTRIQIENLPKKISYYQGERLDTEGLEIKLIYNNDDENTEVIEDGFKITNSSKTLYTQARKRNCICRI